LKFICTDIGLSIEVKKSLIDQLHQLGLKYYPKEYGGLLIGRYVDNNKTVLIEETVLPKQFKSSSFSFERNLNGLKRTLTSFFKKSPSLIYVGEWHTHPNGTPYPSMTDSSALRTIVEHDEVFITNPVLLIIGINPTHYELGFHVLYDNKIYQYEKELIQ